MDEDEYALWAKEESGDPVSGKPEVGKSYTVPNTVWSLRGFYGLGSLLHLGLARDTVNRALKEKGLFVKGERGTGEAFDEALADPDTFGIVWFSHGEGGALYMYTYDASRQEGLARISRYYSAAHEDLPPQHRHKRAYGKVAEKVAKEWLEYIEHHTLTSKEVGRPHHRLALLFLYACQSAHDGGWRQRLVSENGLFLGFTGSPSVIGVALLGVEPVAQPGPSRN